MSLPLVISLLFTGEQIVAHINQKSKLEYSTIRVRKSDLIWIKKNKEIVVNGKMFDIKKIKDIGNYLEITGYYDEAEDKLFSFFYSLFSEDDSNGVQAVKLLSFVFFQDEVNHHNSTDFLQATGCKNKYFLAIEPDLLRRSLDIISPPPNSL